VFPVERAAGIRHGARGVHATRDVVPARRAPLERPRDGADLPHRVVEPPPVLVRRERRQPGPKLVEQRDCADRAGGGAPGAEQIGLEGLPQLPRIGVEAEPGHLPDDRLPEIMSKAVERIRDPGIGHRARFNRAGPTIVARGDGRCPCYGRRQTMPESPGEIESMGSKLFVGGLSWGTTDSTLRAAFEAFGSLREARVILDRETGKSRGFGFVTFSTEEDAQNAIRQMNGAMVDGRTIRVNEAEERRGPGGPGGTRGDRPGGFSDRPGGYGDRPAGGGYGDRGGPGGGYRGSGGPGRDRDRGPRPEVHTRGRAPYGGGADRGPGGPGGPRGDRPWSPGGGGGFRAPAGPQNQQTSDDWGDDRRSRGDRRAKKKAVKQPTGTWDEDAMRMRAPQKREKRESGRTWRDYTADEDFEDSTRPPGDEEPAEGEEKVGDVEVTGDAPAPGDEGAVPADQEPEAEDAIEPGAQDDEDEDDTKDDEADDEDEDEELH